jgi:Flp pilus assembly protein TadB
MTDRPDPRERERPVLDMTPEGEFRETPEPSAMDRFLARTGGIAMLVLFVAGGLLLAAVAILAIGLLLPVAIVAGLVMAVSIWWRRRRLRRAGLDPNSIFFVVRR